MSYMSKELKKAINIKVSEKLQCMKMVLSTIFEEDKKDKRNEKI